MNDQRNTDYKTMTNMATTRTSEVMWDKCNVYRTTHTYEVV